MNGKAHMRTQSLTFISNPFLAYLFLNISNESMITTIIITTDDRNVVSILSILLLLLFLKLSTEKLLGVES